MPPFSSQGVESSERCGELLWVIRWDNACRVPQDQARVTDIGRDARNTGGHSLREDIGKRFGLRRQGQTVKSAEEGSERTLFTQQMKTLFELQLTDPEASAAGVSSASSPAPGSSTAKSGSV